MEDTGSEHGDIVQDAQFFQDTAIEYQAPYHSLEDKYTEQAASMKETSQALQASDSQVSMMQQELLALKNNREADIQRAVSNVVAQYQQQLSSSQSHTHDHQSAITQLWYQVQALQLSLTSLGDLPSVGTPQDEVNLQEEVFNFVPGTVNANLGAAIYHSPDQPFPFHKQVWFGDRFIWPYLTLDTVGDQFPQQPPSSQVLPYSSTPVCGSSQVPLNCTFDVSGIPITNNGNPQDAATIAAEVSAAAAAQASKEFWHMQEPQITKLQGGYLAETKLIFWSWQVDILANIQDCELDNKAMIQLIKEQTLDNANHEVKFQLDLCGGAILYQDLLKHLSIAFQGGNNEVNLLVEFYSCVLACKVISKKPDFRVNLNSTLKQR